jgi:HSP20 family protein
MTSFFEKLKKGMGIEGPVETGVEEKIEKKTKPAKVKKPQKERQIKKLEIKTELIEPEVEEVEDSQPITQKEEKVETKKPSFAPAAAKALAGKKATEGKEKWFETEGELAIDVYQTENDLIIQSAIAGVKPENLEILIEGDVITIKGNREKPEDGGAYFTQECYWGPFSRKVILPVEIDPNRIEATMKEGILTIRLPKIERERKRKIEVKT